MRKGVVLAFAAGTAGTAPHAAEAATYRLSGVLDIHTGYGNNPFFAQDAKGASGLAGATATGTVTRITGKGRTDFSGTADIDQYINHYGTVDNYSATITHNQQISQHLAVQGSANYDNRISPDASFGTTSRDLRPDGDLLTVGQRTQRIGGGLNVTYEPNRRELYQGGVNVSHSGFGGGLASGYTQYSASAGYLRTLNQNTRIGVQAAVTSVRSTRYPSSKSATIGLQLTQRISAVWRFEGGASLLVQKQLGSVFKTIGFNGNLCGKYPKLEVCVLGSRFAAPSGLGGLRTDTQFGGRVNYRLTPLSTIALSATYDVSKSQRGLIPTQKYFDTALEYRRTLSPRISAGVSGRFQGRDYGALFDAVPGSQRKVNAYNATVNVVYKFGRI